MTDVLVGLTGRKGSGKDTAAEAMFGFENVKMAGALKAMLGALLTYQGALPGTVHRMLEGDLKEKPTSLLGGRSPRHAMQTLGTEWGRNLISTDLWIGVAERRIGLFDQVCVSDVRFPNEANMIRRLGGRTYRIERGADADAVCDPHVSEAGIDDLQVDGVIENDCPSANAFKALMREMFLD